MAIRCGKNPKLGFAVFILSLGCAEIGDNPADLTFTGAGRATQQDATPRRDAVVTPTAGAASMGGPISMQPVRGGRMIDAPNEPGGAIGGGAASPETSPNTMPMAGSVEMPIGGQPQIGGMLSSGGEAQPDLGCLERNRCVDTFPFSVSADTRTGVSNWDVYPCKAQADERGPELIYEVRVPAAGFLSAAVYDGDEVDIDVHILTALDPDTCLSRGDRHASADVEAGTYYVVADSYFNGSDELAGAFTLHIGFVEPSTGACEMLSGQMPRVRDGGNHLAMPATGPMVLEAHLVTLEEPEPFPMTDTEELAAHYALSQERTGFVMHRRQAWAPLEGGDFYGAGIRHPRNLPVLDEHWYVNMYWTREARPQKGSRMILRQPNGRRAVVVAAGHETGPGDLSRIGGTPEETHFYMRTTHLDEMTLGISADQSLPLGPRICTD